MTALYDWLLTAALALISLCGVGAVVVFMLSLERIAG
jgi:hypothetical protein